MEKSSDTLEVQSREHSWKSGTMTNECESETKNDHIGVGQSLPHCFQQTDAQIAHVARLSTMGEMVAGIAHELAQPLSAIANFSTACLHELGKLDDGKLDNVDLDNVRLWLQTIRQQSVQSAETIRSMRRFTEGRETSYESFDVAQLVNESRELIAFELRDKGVRLDLDLTSAPTEAFGDVVQIQQVLINLLRNACDAMMENDRQDRVAKLTVCAGDEHVRFTVADCGSGISESNRERMFDPFFTTKETGMGIGLAISAKIVQAHGGRISASNNGKGAVVCFEIPVR